MRIESSCESSERQQEGEMNKLLKTALTLFATGGFAISGTTPVGAESEQVHFYNSPAAAAAKLPFSQAVRVGGVLYMSGAIGRFAGQNGVGAGWDRTGDEADDGEYRRGLEGKRPDFRRRVQMHRNARGHVKMGCIQQGLCDLFQTRAFARALRARR